MKPTFALKFISVCAIRPLGGDQYEISCPPQEWEAVWRDYFDLDTDYYLSDVLKAVFLLQGCVQLRCV